MVDLPRSRALVAFDPNGYLLPIEPVTPPGSQRWRVVHRPPVLALIGAGLFLVAIFASDLVAIALHQIGLGKRGLYAIPLSGGSVVALCYCVFVRVVERRRQIDELEPSLALQEIATGLAGGIALFLGIVALVCAAGDAQVTHFGPSTPLLPALVLASCTATVQEIIMRGEVFRLVERLTGSWIALTVTAAGLGIIQLMGPDATPLSTLAAALQNGVLFAAAFIVTRRLWAGIGLHVGWYLAPSLVTVLTDGPDAMTGGAYGLSSSWPGIALTGLACVTMLLVASRRARIVAPAWTRRTRRVSRADWG